MPDIYTAGGKVDVNEVLAYVGYLENRADHVERMNLHDRDERIWRLEKYVLEELKTREGVVPADWPAFTGNDPRTYWNAIRHAVTSNRPRFRIKIPGPVDLQDAEDQERHMRETTLHENFATGLWQSIDEQRLRRGDLEFQDDLAWHLSVRGGVAIRPWFSPSGRFPFRCAIWDMKTVVWDPGADGLDFIAHHYFDDFYSVLERYPRADRAKLHQDENGLVEVHDIWWIKRTSRSEAVYNCVLACGDYELMPPKRHDQLDHLPAYIVRTFGPTVDVDERKTNTGQDRMTNAWESIYTANAGVYPWLNRVMTLYTLYLRSGAIGPYAAEDTGLPPDQLKQALKPFALIPLKRGGKISPIAQPQMAAEAKELNSLLQGMQQRGSVPSSTFGQIPFELSGFAVNQLSGAVSITAGPVTKAAAWAYRLATDDLIAQFRQKGQDITVTGLDSRGQQFIEDIKRADIRHKYFLDVSVAPELPEDRLQEANIALMWHQMGIDPLTIADEVLKLDNPQATLIRTVAWARIQAEMQALLKPPGAPGGAPGGEIANPPPEVQPPEERGQLEQHAQFQRPAQNVPYEELAAAGFV